MTVSEKALRKLADRKTPVQSYYFDLSVLSQYWSDVRAYHHTAPISLNYALREGLRLIEEEGVSNRFERHQRNHLAFVAGIEALGLKMFALPEVRALDGQHGRGAGRYRRRRGPCPAARTLRYRNRGRSRTAQGPYLESRPDGNLVNPQQHHAAAGRLGRHSVRKWNGRVSKARVSQRQRPPTATSTDDGCTRALTAIGSSGDTLPN